MSPASTMPSIVTQVVQAGLESPSAYGTAVAADKVFSAMGFEPSIKTEISKYRASGSKGIGLTALNKEHVEGPVKGLMTYTEIIYALASAIGNMVTVAGADGTYTHTFHSKNRGRDAVASYTIEKGDPSIGNGRRATGCIFQELGIKFSHDSIDLTGALIGKAIEMSQPMSTNEKQLLTMSVAGGAATGGSMKITVTVGADPQQTAAIAYDATGATVQTALEALSNVDVGDVSVTGASKGPWTIEFTGALAQTNMDAVTVDTTTAGSIVTGPGAPYTCTVTTPQAGVAPTAVELIPVLPGELEVHLADTLATVGDAGTLLEGVLSVEFKVGNRQKPFWPLNRALGSSFKELLESVPDVTAVITMADDQDADDLVTAMRSGDTKFLRVDALGPIAGGAVHYAFHMDLALAISDHNGFSEQDPVYAAGVKFDAIVDGTWGQSNEFVCVNKQATL